MQELPAIDPAALQRLQRLGGGAFVRQMIDLFLDYAPKKLAAARAAHAAANLDAVAEAVHPLKSSAGNVGAARVQDLANRAESIARAGPSPLLAALLAELEEAFAEVQPEFERKKREIDLSGAPARLGPASPGA
jgi:HPt (histidine-containing phosphotransfer) domain-containing protein